MHWLDPGRTKDDGGCPEPYLISLSRKQDGRKRHIMATMLGYIIKAIVPSADIQGREDAPLMVSSDGRWRPSDEKLCTTFAHRDPWTIGIIRRSDRTGEFVVLPKRWTVGRSPVLLGCCCRPGRIARRQFHLHMPGRSASIPAGHAENRLVRF